MVSFLWQGQKDLNPRHAVLEDCILSLFIAVYRLSGGTLGGTYCFLKEKCVVKTTNFTLLILYIFTYYSFNIHPKNLPSKSSHIRLTSCYKVEFSYQITGGFVMKRKTKIKFTDFECNLLINGMNEFRNMLLSEGISTEDVDELLLKIINQSER